MFPVFLKIAKTFWRHSIQDNNDQTFLQALTYLIEGNVLDVNTTPASGDNVPRIPEWTKNTICLWSHDQISDDEFLAAMEFLIDENVIRL